MPSRVLSSVVLPPPFGPSRARAPLRRDVEAATDHAIAVADGEVATGKAHDQVRCMPASSQMKNGVPMTAVRIPSGISTGAAVRARVSMKRR
jgi:hypothetical protein